MEHAPVADRSPSAAGDTVSANPAPAAPGTGGCPFPHAAAIAPGCPVPHGASTANPASRTRADLVVRRILRVPAYPAPVSEAVANRGFQRSMIVSGVRCTLTYLLFPFVLPLFGIAARVGPALGLAIGSIAIVSNVFTIRRFFAADHRYRWHFSALALSVIVLLAVLLVRDVAAIT